MVEFLARFLSSPRWLFKSRARLEAENLVLRRQLNVIGRRAVKRISFKLLYGLVILRQARRHLVRIAVMIGRSFRIASSTIIIAVTG